MVSASLLSLYIVLPAVWEAAGSDAGPECLKDTFGSCKVLGCDASRNAACEKGKCVCKGRTCNYEGTCMDQTSCTKKTGGSCSFLSCDASRNAVCHKDESSYFSTDCMCSPGSCAVNGECVLTCEKDTGLDCPLLQCSGDSNAHCAQSEGYRCKCGPGHCASDGKCQKAQTGVGVLNLLGSNASQGNHYAQSTSNAGASVLISGNAAPLLALLASSAVVISFGSRWLKRLWYVPDMNEPFLPKATSGEC